MLEEPTPLKERAGTTDGAPYGTRSSEGDASIFLLYESPLLLLWISRK
jgi:hypothetical protein